MEKTLTVCVVGDAPNLPTGLSRIARDLTMILWGVRERLGINVVQLGWGYDGSPWPWAVYPMINEEGWGQGSLERVARWVGEVPLVFTIWDAGRCFGLLEGAPVRELWGYFPIDSHNIHGKIGGPGEETLKFYQRVLGYGEFGARVLQNTRGDGRVKALPHGIDMATFQPVDAEAVLHDADKLFVGRDVEWLKGLAEAQEGTILVGGVATNQPRKDLALFFATASKLRERWPQLRLWLHSDKAESEAWSITELARIFGFNNNSFTLTLHEATDAELACAYSLCNVTLAVGSGEGFGYPIVESLACGTPVVHGNFGGGVELTPSHWRVQSEAMRLAGATALLRPVYNPEDWAFAAKHAINWGLQSRGAVRSFCRSSVKNLDWGVLAQHWVKWFEEGFEAVRRDRAAEKLEAGDGE